MPDQNQIEMVQAPKMGVTFERTVQVRPYEMAKASVYVQADVPINATPEQIEEALSGAFFQAKAVVFDQLGLSFNVDEHGVVREMIEKVLGPVDVVTDTAAPTAAPTASQAPAGGTPGPCAGTNADGSPCGKTDYWDNRVNKKNPKAPDWKCKSCGKGVWSKK